MRRLHVTPGRRVDPLLQRVRRAIHDQAHLLLYRAVEPMIGELDKTLNYYSHTLNKFIAWLRKRDKKLSFSHFNY